MSKIQGTLRFNTFFQDILPKISKICENILFVYVRNNRKKNLNCFFPEYFQKMDQPK